MLLTSALARRVLWTGLLGWGVVFAPAALEVTSTQVLPISGGTTGMGAVAMAGNQAGAVYTEADGTAFHLAFYRFDANAHIVAQRVHSLDMDLQFVGTGGLFFAKGQTSDAFAITTHPIVLSLAQPALNQPALALARTPTGLRLQWPVTVPAFRLQQTPALV